MQKRNELGEKPKKIYIQRGIGLEHQRQEVGLVSQLEGGNEDLDVFLKRELLWGLNFREK